MSITRIAAVALAAAMVVQGTSIAQPAGTIQGSAFEHTPASAVAAIEGGHLALPPAMTGGTAFFGKWRDRPANIQPGPVIVFLHGSSGLKLGAIEEWQKWLSGLGLASVAPDSFALPDRLTYSSPIDKKTYERVHALRATEIVLALNALKRTSWADPGRLVLAGTSEGATAVARNADSAFAARLIYSWSCEDNYFVEAHGTRVSAEQPVMNVISSVDPFFSTTNTYLGNANARGNCAAALAEAKRAVVALVPGAPHTLINFPYARAITKGFLEAALGQR